MKYILAIFMTSSLYAATTATLNLRGVIASILEVSVAAEPIANTLALDVSQTQTKVATLTERSNSQTGYKVSFSSANLGKLIRVGGSQFIPYTFHYGVSPVNLASVTQFNKVFTNAAPLNTDLKITYTGVDLNNYPAGEYTDTLTITISAN